MFKTFRLLLNLFQIDGPINEMFFLPQRLFSKGISKTICDLALRICELLLYIFHLDIIGKSSSNN